MGTLAQLDETRPLNSDNLSAGDDAIRETRLAIKTTFAVEHTLIGAHVLPNGTTAARPAPGTGRLYINNDLGRVQFAVSGAWQSVGNFTVYNFDTGGAAGYIQPFLEPSIITVVCFVPQALAGVGRPNITVEPPWLHGDYYDADDQAAITLIKTYAGVTKLTITQSAGINFYGYVMVYA